MLKFIKPAFFGCCLILFGAMYAKIGVAVGSYYLDSKKNDRSYSHQSYTQSEVYADVSTTNVKTYNDAKTNTYADAGTATTNIINNDKDIKVYNSSSTSTITDGKGRKIYNTIIIKKNKNNKSTKQVVKKGATKKVKVLKTEEPEKKEEQPKTIKKKVVNKKRYDNENLRPEERAKRDAEQIEENKQIAEEKYEVREEEYKSDTKKQEEEEDNSSTPSSWYLYGFGGYSMGIPLFSKFDTIIDNVKQPRGEFPFSHGFHLGAGVKIYGWHFFIAPEIVYQRFSTTLYSQADKLTAVSSYGSFGTDTWVQLDDYDYIETKRVMLRDLLTGSFRMGITFGNSFSIYVKGNVGMINMQTSVINSVVNNDLLASKTDLEIATVQSQLQKKSFTKNNWGFVYGVGAGVEALFLRQHLFMRLEYNYYLMPSYNKVAIPSGADATSGSESGSGSGSGSGTTPSENQDKIIQYRADFGTILLSVGVAF